MIVLNKENCDLVIDSLQIFESCVEEYCMDIERAIKVFNEHPIVQSFYASGGFGKGMEVELEKVRDGVRRYYQVIASDGGLIQTTRNVVLKQMELLDKSTNERG